MHLAPETCFVLDDGTGRAIGYCIGTADTTSFVQKWRDSFVSTIDPRIVPHQDVQTDNATMEKVEVKGYRSAVYNANCSTLQDYPELLQSYPAHMHIDILPEYQRKGHGTALIHEYFRAAKSAGARGVHLGMVLSNSSARSFYERMGFDACPHVLDGGKSGLRGVNEGVVTLVRLI